MKKILVLFLVLFVISACSSVSNEINEEILEQELEANSDADVQVEIEDGTTNVEYSDGDETLTVTATEGNTDDWCNEDFMTTIQQTGNEGLYTVEILGIEETGDYEGYCKGEMQIQSEAGNLIYTYYWDEDEHGTVMVEGTGAFEGQSMSTEF